MTEDDAFTSNRVGHEEESRIRELERQLGRKTMEAETLSEARATPIERLRWRSKPRQRILKAVDADLMPQFMTLIARAQPTATAGSR